MKPLLLGIAIAVSVVALRHARRQYRTRGRLTWTGLSLVCAMLFVPNLILHEEARYELPDSPMRIAGAVVSASGLLLCLFGVVAFRSVAKVMCLDPGRLTVAGPYRFGRNPQYVGWIVLLFGFVLMDPSWWSLAAVLVVALALHRLVLIEEEHLGRVFGEAYRAFTRATPRYFGVRRSTDHRSGPDR